MVPIKALRWGMLAFALSGCGGDGGTAPTVDAAASMDAVTDMGAPDAGGSDAAVEAAVDVPAVCEVGAPPATPPMVSMSVVVRGGDAGADDTPSGGEPDGRWIITGGMLVLPAQAEGLIDTSMSTIEGTGWGVFEAGRYTLSTDFDMALSTTVAGRVRAPIQMQSRGRFVRDGVARLTLTPDCSSGASGQGMVTGFAFSRDSADRGRLYVGVRGMAGVATLVAELRRVP